MFGNSKRRARHLKSQMKFFSGPKYKRAGKIAIAKMFKKSK